MNSAVDGMPLKQLASRNGGRVANRVVLAVDMNGHELSALRIDFIADSPIDDVTLPREFDEFALRWPKSTLFRLTFAQMTPPGPLYDRRRETVNAALLAIDPPASCPRAG